MSAIKFEANDLQKIDKANDLKISPFRADGRTYGTPTWIWAVVVDGSLYVRAYSGKKGRWYRAASVQKSGRIHAAGMVKDVLFETVSDTGINNQIDEAYRLKYNDSPYMEPMISMPAREATIKITPVN